MSDPVMQHIAKETLLGAAQTIENKTAEISRLEPLADQHKILMGALEYGSVSCSGLDITIAFSNHDQKETVMNILCSAPVFR